MARKNLQAVQPVELVLEHNKPMASSLQVAKHFGKDHNHVLRDIRNLLEDLPEEWAASNFGPTFITVDMPHNAARQDPAYLLTRDGFTLLAMGFTGKRALAWKLKYIDAFNQMEAALRHPDAGRRPVGGSCAISPRRKKKSRKSIGSGGAACCGAFLSNGRILTTCRWKRPKCFFAPICRFTTLRTFCKNQRDSTPL